MGANSSSVTEEAIYALMPIWDNALLGLYDMALTFRGPALKSLRSPQHRELLRRLVAARRSADLTQQDLAKQLRRHQSFVAKYEGGERRLEVI